MSTLTYDDLFSILGECSDPEEPTSAPGRDAVDESLEGLGYDSLSLLDFAAVLEKRFGVVIPDTEVTEARTPRALLTLVNAGIAGSGRRAAETFGRYGASGKTVDASGWPGLAGPRGRIAETAVLRRRRGFVQSAVTVPMPAEELFGLVADASRWPVLFPSAVHVEQLDRQGRTDRSRVWESAVGPLTSRILRRVVNRDRLHIAFSWDEGGPASEGAARAAGRAQGGAAYRELAGEWRFRPLVGGATEVVLRQRYTLDEYADPEPAADAVRRDSARWLGALARMAGLGVPAAAVLLSVTEDVLLPAPLAEVYRRVHAAFDGGAARAGRRGAGERVVAGEPGRWIACKDIDYASPLLGRCELWSFTPNGAGTRAEVVHLVLIDPAAAAQHDGAREAALSGLRAQVGQELRRCTASVFDAARASR